MEVLTVKGGREWVVYRQVPERGLPRLRKSRPKKAIHFTMDPADNLVLSELTALSEGADLKGFSPPSSEVADEEADAERQAPRTPARYFIDTPRAAFTGPPPPDREPRGLGDPPAWARDLAVKVGDLTERFNNLQTGGGGEGQKSQPPPAVPPRGGEDVDLVDLLVNRMAGNLDKNDGQARAGTTSARPCTAGNLDKNDDDLQTACRQLLIVGTQPLRVNERLARSLTIHFLKQHDTFARYVESKGIQGGRGREARTLARILDLGISTQGVDFVQTAMAEVGIRRLLSIAIATQSGGSFQVGGTLEEIPSDAFLSDLPKDLVETISRRLKTEAKLTSYLEKPKKHE